MSDHTIVVERVRVGVNMGDHAQDVTTAVEVTPETTLGELVPLLLEKRWRVNGPADHAPRDGDFLVVRLARPIPDLAEGAL